MLLSLVVPLYNEEEMLAEFHLHSRNVLDTLGMDIEYVYVNDGSSDRSMEILHSLRADDNRISIVDLSRNFGKEIALTAGLDHATGDAVVVIDADLQDPPELIPEFIKRWKEGYDVVYAKRISRQGETVLKKASAAAFYWIIHRVTIIDIPQATGDFRLLSRRAVDALSRIRERHRFMKGLFAWIGFPQIAVPYERNPRFAGTTKWNYWRLWNLAMEGFTSFSTGPLKLATYLGLLTALSSFIYGLIIILQKLIFGNPIPGYPSLMVVILFLGGIQLMALGVIGEYLGRTFNEAKHRPLYLLKGYEPSELTSRMAADEETNGTG